MSDQENTVLTTTEPTVDLLNIFSNDRHMILYRPEWRKITGSVTATILLQQILYRWDKHNREPFYKFREPCNHALCRDGDTWTQELGFSKFEFDNALKKIGFKRTGKNKDTVNTAKPIEYWTDINRTTYYTIIPETLTDLLESLYSSGFTKINKVDLPVNQQNGFTSFNTETTKERTLAPPEKQTPLPEQPSSTPPPLPSTDKQPTAAQPGTQTAKPGDLETALTALVLLIPEDMKKPSTVARVAKAIEQGLAMDLIKSCIEYSNDHSDQKTWIRYKSHLGQCIDGQWGAGYSTGDTGADDAAREQAFMESRRTMPDSILKMDADKGCKASAKVLQERGNS